MTGRPIRPEELKKAPPEVYDAFNTVIQKNWNLKARASEFSCDDVAVLIGRSLELSLREVYDKHYLYVSAEYQDAGWMVTCEAGVFTFKVG